VHTAYLSPLSVSYSPLFVQLPILSHTDEGRAETDVIGFTSPIDSAGPPTDRELEQRVMTATMNNELRRSSPTLTLPCVQCRLTRAPVGVWKDLERSNPFSTPGPNHESNPVTG